MLGLGLGLGLLIRLQSLHIQHIPALIEQELIHNDTRALLSPPVSTLIPCSRVSINVPVLTPRFEHGHGYLHLQLHYVVTRGSDLFKYLPSYRVKSPSHGHYYRVKLSSLKLIHILSNLCPMTILE
jgi:hypothetical protein